MGVGRGGGEWVEEEAGGYPWDLVGLQVTPVSIPHGSLRLSVLPPECWLWVCPHGNRHAVRVKTPFPGRRLPKPGRAPQPSRSPQGGAAPKHRARGG